MSARTGEWIDMTVRAVLLGLLGAAAICAFGFFNDMMMRGTFLVGNYMPISVYGLLIAFLLFANPLLLLLGGIGSPLTAGVVAGISGGLGTAVATGLVTGLLAGPAAGLTCGLVSGVAVGVGVGFAAGSLPGRAGGLVGAVAGALVGGLATGIAVGVSAGTGWAVLGGLLAGVLSGAVAGLAASRLVLSGRELAVIVALILPACYVPGRGLMHYFTTVLMLPHHYERTDPGWQEQAVVKMTPEVMLASVSPVIAGEDIVDPRGLAAALVGEGHGPASGPGSRIWALLPEEDREAIRAGLDRSRTGPDESWRPRAKEALSAALDGRQKRREERRAAHSRLMLRQEALRKQAQEAREAEGGAGEEPDEDIAGEEVEVPAELSPEEVRSLRDAVAGALERPGAETPGGIETVSELDGGMEKLGFSERERRPVTEAVRDALWEAEAPCRDALLDVLNPLLDRRDLYCEPDFTDTILPKEATHILELGLESLPENVRDEKARVLNRHLVDSAYPKEMTGLVSKKDYAVSGFVRGVGVGTQDISFWQIPWYAWMRTLFFFWFPLLLAFSFAVIGLALVVHRQWSDHEHLAYPIVTFARSLLPEGGRSSGSVFRNRLFWIAMCTVAFIHLNNYAYRWWPQQLVEIPRYFDFRSLAWHDLPIFRTMRRGWVGLILNPTIYFTAIGFAYFVPSDVSLSLGLAAFIYAWVSGLFIGYGVSFGGGGWMSATRVEGSLFAGAYFGMFLFLVYTGRRYYATVFRRSLWVPARDKVEPSAVWGARVFMVCATLFALRLITAGLGWQWAVLYTLGSAMLYLVMSRVVAETGMFFIHAYWFPGVLMYSFLGAKAMGPQTMLIMFLVSCVLLIDPREAVMPFAVHGIKLADATGAKPGRTALWGALALVIGFAAATPVVLYLQYKVGANAVGDGWTLNVPKFTYNEIASAKQTLAAQDALTEAGNVSGLSWFRTISGHRNSIIGFFATFTLVLLFAGARLRFARWPLHPVLFLAMGSWQSRCLAVSFLIGWFIKTMVTKYGGAGVYQRLKPAMIGLIAGDMLGGVIPMLIGAVYYFATGEMPKEFRVLPT